VTIRQATTSPTTFPAGTETPAAAVRPPTRRRLGRRARALLTFAFAASFVLLTYASAESGTTTHRQVAEASAVHVQR
jgi:hypothetical protein